MTFTANQRLTIVLSFLAALFLTFVGGYTIGTDETPLFDRFMYECEKVDISTMGDDLLALHFSHGYKGDYRDGSDNLLYSPGCNVPTAPWLLTQPE